MPGGLLKNISFNAVKTASSSAVKTEEEGGNFFLIIFSGVTTEQPTPLVDYEPSVYMASELPCFGT